MYGGSFGYAECRKLQQNAGTITATTLDPVNLFKKGIANKRNRNSSLVAASIPMATPAIHGNVVFTEFS